jgi:hypothetical protein
MASGEILMVGGEDAGTVDAGLEGHRSSSYSQNIHIKTFSLLV